MDAPARAVQRGKRGRMTLDEAIKHAEEVAKEQEKLGKCAEEHRQLAKWLRELRVFYSLRSRVESGVEK